MLKRLLLLLFIALPAYAQVTPQLPNRILYADQVRQITSTGTLTYLDSTRGAILTVSSLAGGSGYSNGTHNNTPLTGGSGFGATATVTVAGGVVTGVGITIPGQRYVVGDVLSASTSFIGGGAGFTVTVSTIDMEHLGIGTIVPAAPFHDNVASIFANVNTFPSTSQLRVGDHVNGASLNNYTQSVYGVMSVESYMTIVGSAGSQQQGNANQLVAEKQAMYLFTDSTTGKHRIGSTRYDSSVSYLPLALETAGAEVLKISTDPFVQWTASYTGSTLSASGTFAVRNNAGAMEISQNGGAWAALTSGSLSCGGTCTAGDIPKFSSGTAVVNSIFKDDGSNHIIPLTDVASDLGTTANRWRNALVGNYILLGTGTTDLNLSAPIYAVTGNDTGFAAAGASSDASTISMTIANGTCSCFNAGHTGSGTFLPMMFATNGSEQIEITTAGHLVPISDADHTLGSTSLRWQNLFVANYEILGNSSTDASLAVPTYISVADKGGFLSASASTNSSSIYIGVDAADGFTSINSGRTGSGTRLPFKVFTNAREAFRLDNDATNAVCVFVGSAMHRLTLSGGTFIDGGTC